MPQQNSSQSSFAQHARFRRMIRNGYSLSAHLGCARKPDPDTNAPLFIIGSGRSGNTLVRRIILASKQMYIPPETYVMGDILENWPRTLSLTWEQRVWLFCAHFERHIHFGTFSVESLNEFARDAVRWSGSNRHVRALFNGFYQYLAVQSGSKAKRWGEKTPWNVYHLPAIGFHYPNANYLWLLRDGRDAAYSYTEAGLYPDLQTSAARWTEANQFCATFARQGFNVRRQRYEDLVQDPEAQFREIFEWAGLTFDPVMLTRQPGRMGDVEMLEHHVKVGRPISSSSVGRWKKHLTTSDLDTLPRSFHSQLHRFGYSD